MVEKAGGEEGKNQSGSEVQHSSDGVCNLKLGQKLSETNR